MKISKNDNYQNEIDSRQIVGLSLKLQYIRATPMVTSK
jgi:hypothetical protein